MNIDQFDYCLPDNLIAHRPAEPRHSSRLMIIDRASKKIDPADGGYRLTQGLARRRKTGYDSLGGTRRRTA